MIITENEILAIKELERTSICSHCKTMGNIRYVVASEPYSEDHFHCKKCDSTFNIGENKYQCIGKKCTLKIKCENTKPVKCMGDPVK